MCIIVVSKTKEPISKNTFDNCWENNADGGGLMYAHAGKVHVKKELTDNEHFYAMYLEAKKLTDTVVLHFRIGTSGSACEFNIHPFKVHKGLYFCHNGILDIKVPEGAKENDTQVFNNGLLKRLPGNFLSIPGIKELLTYTIGKSNKFVFLDKSGTVTILNEQAGHWKDGNWYSNYTYSYCYSGYSLNTDWQEKWNYTAKDWNKKEPKTRNWDEMGLCDCCGKEVIIAALQYSHSYNLDLCVKCWKEFETEPTEYGEQGLCDSCREIVGVDELQHCYLYNSELCPACWEEYRNSGQMKSGMLNDTNTVI